MLVTALNANLVGMVGLNVVLRPLAGLILELRAIGQTHVVYVPVPDDVEFEGYVLAMLIDGVEAGRVGGT
jgi:hypothetical protein